MKLMARLSSSAIERGLLSLRWIARKRGRAREMPRHLATGLAGEEAALFYLRRQGFTIVAQRWNEGPAPGDIDLVAWQGDRLCFIEVKTRTSREVATASSAVDRNKRKTLRRMARMYMRHLPETEPPAVRFDIVTVYERPGRPREIQLIPAAFGWSEVY